MKLTITIEDETGARAVVRPAETGAAVLASAGLPAEAEATSAGGPPPWLLQELEGAAAEPEGPQSSRSPIDAGQAPTENEDGLVSILGRLAQGS